MSEAAMFLLWLLFRVLYRADGERRDAEFFE